MRSMKSVFSLFKKHNKKLILHFDVNKTLILSDKAGGKSLSDIINQVLMQSIYGFAKDWNKPGLGLKSTENDCKTFINDKWIPIEGYLQTKAPKIEELEEKYKVYSNRDEYALMSFDSFVSDVLYPYPKNNGNEKVSNEDHVITNKAIKKLRKHIIQGFTDENGLGRDYLEEKKKIFYSLLRASYKEKFTKPEDLSEVIMKEQEDHFVFILPGFFKLLTVLIEHQIDYNLVIRTFGDKHDIDLVLEEFNLFCKGEHELQKIGALPVLPQLASRALTIEKPTEQFGYTFRSEIHEGETLIVLGSLDKLPMTSDPFKEQKDAVAIHRGAKELYKLITSVSNQTFLFRDYYEYWSLHNEHPSAGKLFPLDPNDADVCQIFFDDNAYIPSIRERGIIDVRHPSDESSLYSQYKDFERGEIVHVYPLESAVNEDYFIEKVVNSIHSFSTRNKL